MPISEADRSYLKQCVDLAREAVEAGDEPFGSLLVDANGKVIFKDRNRINTNNDVTYHPEFTIVLYAQKHMSHAERAASIVYTSGEHCQMCSTAHGFAGLGRIVFASSSEQLGQWKTELGADPGSVTTIPVKQILPRHVVDGPDEHLANQVRKLHAQQHTKSK